MEVKLHIENKLSAAYLRMVFGANKTGDVAICRDVDMGKHIVSRVRYTNIQPKQTIGITLSLPQCQTNHDHDRFCYFSIEDQDKISDYVAADFKIWFKTIMATATTDLNLTRKDAIEHIIDLMNLKNDPTIYDTLKKYDYRRRQYIKKMLLKTIQSVNL